MPIDLTKLHVSKNTHMISKILEMRQNNMILKIVKNKKQLLVGNKILYLAVLSVSRRNKKQAEENEFVLLYGL